MTDFVKPGFQVRMFALELDIKILSDANTSHLRHSEMLHCIANRSPLRDQAPLPWA